VPCLTNETIFDLVERPRHLLVIGGGPIGVELAQAFRRLGAAVSLVEMATLLPKDDPELVQVVRQRLHDEGVALHERTRVTAVEPAADGVALLTESDGNKSRIEGSHLLVAVGAAPTSPASISPPPASRTPRPASPSTPICAPATGASMPSATPSAGCNSPIWPATMRAS